MDEFIPWLVAIACGACVTLVTWAAVRYAVLYARDEAEAIERDDAEEEE